MTQSLVSKQCLRENPENQGTFTGYLENFVLNNFRGAHWPIAP